MLGHFIARSLFNLNLVMSIRRRTTTLETIAENVVVDACKSHKTLERKSRAKISRLSIVTKSLPSLRARTSSASLVLALESTTTPYTIH